MKRKLFIIWYTNLFEQKWLPPIKATTKIVDSYCASFKYVIQHKFFNSCCAAFGVKQLFKSISTLFKKT